MAKTPKVFYRYRSFSIATLESLCKDYLYFSNPGSFNDPLDCSPTLDCDSSNDELRKLLEFLTRRRVKSEVLVSLKKAKMKGEGAKEHAVKHAHSAAENELAYIAYNATDPYYEMELIQAESWLLVQAIERELSLHYERGVCCFSSTYSNPLLWSHYGDQHRGLCVGFTVERNPVPKLNEVVYGGSRAIKTSLLIKAFIVKDAQAKLDLDRDVLLRKAGGWRYEKEWRLIGSQGLQESPLLLYEVVFGLRCAESIKHAIVNSLAGRENETQFFEMYSVRGSYALRRRKLDVHILNSYLPKTAASGVEIFGELVGEG